MKRILFVDDESEILDGIRRMLHARTLCRAQDRRQRAKLGA
jgi:hypothetical protein